MRWIKMNDDDEFSNPLTYTKSCDNDEEGWSGQIEVKNIGKCAKTEYGLRSKTYINAEITILYGEKSTFWSGQLSPLTHINPIAH